MNTQPVASSLVAYRPFLYTAAGLLTAYGTYAVLTALVSPQQKSSRDATPQRSTGLRRRNATRRPPEPRRENPGVSWTFRDGTPEQWPLCSLRNDHGTWLFTIENGLPTVDQVSAALGMTDEEAEGTIEVLSVPFLERIFLHIHHFGGDMEELAAFRQALLTQDHAGLLRERSAFASGRWQFTDWAYETTTDMWLNLNRMHVDDMRRDGIERSHNARIGHQHQDETNSAPSLEDDTSETLDTNSHISEGTASGQGLKALLYHIAEEEAKKKAYVHRGTRCDACDKNPITGIRWHCINCPDFDLCSTCEAMNTHPKHHVFAKIQIPICTMIQPQTGEMQEPWYPGGVNVNRPPLTAVDRSCFSHLYHFDEAQIDAYNDQFHCLCGEHYDPKTKQIVYAIDRNLFYKAYINDKTGSPIAPNYVYDRMFDFYDISNRDYISFEAFLAGLDYILHPSKRVSQSRTFKGFDSDGDKYISRADVVRMFRAKYVIHSKLIMDAVLVEDAYARALNREAARVMRSSQPISSLFADDDVPSGEHREPFNKPQDRFGDAQVLPHALYGQPTLPNGQTDMDTTFWEAVFEHHGRPDQLSDLHPDFQNKLGARLEVRDSYVGTESYMLDGNADRYLVRADSRQIRPLTSDQVSLQEEWRQDISRSNTGHGVKEERKEETTSLEEIMNRDRAYETTQRGRDIGLDVLYQTVDDGLNELFDKMFSVKESLAQRVTETADQRKKFRDKIDAYVNGKANGHISKKTENGDFNTLIEHDTIEAQKSTSTGSEDEHDAERTELPTSSGIAMNPSSGPATETTPATMFPPTEPQPRPSSNGPQLGQTELMDRLQEESVPTDFSSLARMEDDIRNQDIHALLAAAGYSVTEPTVTAPVTALEDDALADDSLVTGPSAQASLFVMDDEPLARSASPSPSPVEAVLPLTWNASSVTASQTLHKTSAAERKKLSQPEQESMSEPSDEQLEEWARLDVHEKEMLERGGPARINLAEFEEIIKLDSAEGGVLKGLLDSWLEWAAF